MRYLTLAIFASTFLLMDNVASAHSGHAHVGTYWKPGAQPVKFALISKARGGAYVTYIGPPVDCNPLPGFGRGCNNCFPNCYFGTPCQCCEHKAHYTLPCSKFGKLLKTEVDNGNAYEIQRPSLMDRLHHSATFQPR